MRLPAVEQARKTRGTKVLFEAATTWQAARSEGCDDFEVDELESDDDLSASFSSSFLFSSSVVFC
jgi:hypothetical protein